LQLRGLLSILSAICTDFFINEHTSAIMQVNVFKNNSITLFRLCFIYSLCTSFLPDVKDQYADNTQR